MHGLTKEIRASAPSIGPGAWRSPSAAKKTEELSKGMQQKIQFIASLLHDPGLIVMESLLRASIR